jgi:hypothetical protein
MPVVRMPDGALVRFPDDMPAEQIRGMILKKYPDLKNTHVKDSSSNAPAVLGESAPTHNPVTQYMLNGGGGSATFGAIFVTLLGALAAALVYRLVRGSWRSTSDTRQRKWMALALVIPISAGASRLANAALWSDSRDLELALAYFLIWAPLFAGAAFLLAKFFKTKTDVSTQAVKTTPATSTVTDTPIHTDPYQQAVKEGQMEDQQTKFFSKNLAIVVAVGIGLYIVIIAGFQKFFISFGIAPLATIAAMIGTLAVPIIPTYFVAKLIQNKKRIPHLYSWVAGTIILLLIMGIGIIRGGGA